MGDQIEYLEKSQKIIDSFNGHFEKEVEINGKFFTVQREVYDLILSLSLERDKLKKN